MRNRVIGYSDKSYTQWRVDALKALEDAREEQKELVLEEIGLLEMMQTTRARVKIDNEQEREEDELVEQEEENEGQA
jgi:hypothetical protein